MDNAHKHGNFGEDLGNIEEKRLTKVAEKA